MTDKHYTSEYNQFVKTILKRYEKLGFDFDTDERITEPVATCKWLLEDGAIHRYYDTTNRLLALFMYGFEYGVLFALKAEKKAVATTNDNCPQKNVSPKKQDKNNTKKSKNQ